MIRSFLYVGMAKDGIQVEGEGLRLVVDDFARRLQGRGITGGLVCTPTFLANIVEGPEEVIEQVNGAHSPSPLFACERLALVEPIKNRRFIGWSLIYSGSTLFVTNRLRHLWEQTDEQKVAEQAREVVQMMTLFQG